MVVAIRQHGRMKTTYLRLLLVVAVLGAAVAAVVPAGDAVSLTNPTFELVPFPKSECLAPKVIRGRACLDRSGQILSADWQSRDGSAKWSPTGWTNNYRWTVPTTIAPSGAAIKLSLAVTGKQPGSICGAIGARGSFPLKEPGDIDLHACADQGKTMSKSLTLRVVPPSSGPGYVIIGLGDGPAFTYKYEAKKPKPPACRGGRPTGAASQTPPFKVEVETYFDGVPDSGESPTLYHQISKGKASLIICDPPEARGSLASRVTGTFEHTETHAIPPHSVVMETIKLKAVAGAYNAAFADGPKVALSVVVTESEDKQCPKGSTGRLSLHYKPFGADVMTWKLCGVSHSHTFIAEEGGVEGYVRIKESAP